MTDVNKATTQPSQKVIKDFMAKRNEQKARLKGSRVVAFQNSELYTFLNVLEQADDCMRICKRGIGIKYTAHDIEEMINTYKSLLVVVDAFTSVYADKSLYRYSRPKLVSAILESSELLLCLEHLKKLC